MAFLGIPSAHWGIGAGAFGDAFLRAYQAFAGQRLAQEKLAEERRLAQERLAEERRQAEVLESYKQAQKEYLAAQKEHLGLRTQVEQAQLDELRRRAQRDFEASMAVRGLLQRPTHFPHEPEVSVAHQLGHLPPPPQLTYEEMAMAVLPYLDPERVTQVAQNLAAIQQAQKQYKLQEREIAAKEKLIESQAFENYAKTIASLSGEKDLSTGRLTEAMKTYLFPMFPGMLYSKEEERKALEYLHANREHFLNQFLPWWKITQTPLVTGEGIFSHPSKPPMPSMPPSPHQPPTPPGTAPAPPAVPTPGAATPPGTAQRPLQLQPLLSPTGEKLGKPLAGESIESLSSGMTLLNSVKEVKRLLEKHPGATGPQMAGYSWLSERIPYLPQFESIQEIKPAMRLLYDTVYLKSGKAISQPEAEILMGYIPQPSDKPLDVKFKTAALEHHLYSLIYNRAMLMKGNNYTIPESLRNVVKDAEQYFAKTGKAPVPGFGLRDPVTGRLPENLLHVPSPRTTGQAGGGERHTPPKVVPKQQDVTHDYDPTTKKLLGVGK